MNLKKSLIIGASVLALAPVASATFVSSNANVQLTDEDIVNLFEKYEGATVTVTPTNNSSLRAASASGSSY